MKIDNKKIYETGEAVDKYSINSTRVRSLNNAEKNFIDFFDVKNKNVLVLGSGAGRVPANLLLFGNKVKGIELSNKLNETANQIFPNKKFTDLILEQGDATDLKNIPDNSYDVVFFPMNGLDLVSSYEMRHKALQEMSKKVKKGGLLAFSSHNKLAYIFTPKLPIKNKSLKYAFGNYIYDEERVAGGGYSLRVTQSL